MEKSLRILLKVLEHKKNSESKMLRIKEITSLSLQEKQRRTYSKYMIVHKLEMV